MPNQQTMPTRYFVGGTPGSGMFDIFIGASPNVPHGYREIQQQQVSSLAQQHADIMRRNREAKARGERVTGVTGDPDEWLKRITGQLGEQREQMVAEYTHPFTGELLKFVPRSQIEEIEKWEEEIRAGTRRRLPGGGSVPVGSPADTAIQEREREGEQITGQTLGALEGGEQPPTGRTEIPHPRSTETQTAQEVMAEYQEKKATGEYVFEDGKWYEVGGEGVGEEGTQLPRAEQLQQIREQMETAGQDITGLQDIITRAEAEGYGIGTGRDIPDWILGGEAGAGAGAGGGYGYDTGNETLNEMLRTFQDTITSIIDSGRIVNPQIDITPERLAELTSQVAAELDPYYQSQFEAIREDLSADLTYLSDQYSQVMRSQEEQFKQTLAGQRETEAGRGTIFGGERLTREQSLAQQSQRNIEALGTSLSYQAGKAGRATERTIGSLGLAGLTSPTWTPYSISTIGRGGYNPLGGRALFSPKTGITGTLEREKIEKSRSYLDLLKKAELGKLNV